MTALVPLHDLSWRVLPHLVDDDRPWWRRWLGPPPCPRELTAPAVVRAVVAVVRELGGADALRPDRDLVQVVLPLAAQRRLRADRRGLQALVGEVLLLGVPVRVELVPDVRGALRAGEVVVRVVRRVEARPGDPGATVRAGAGGPERVVPAEWVPSRVPGAGVSGADRTLGVLDPWDAPEPPVLPPPHLLLRLGRHVLAEVAADVDVVVGRGGVAGCTRVALPVADPRISREHVVVRLEGEHVSVRRPIGANPVALGGEALHRDTGRTASLPVELQLSQGALVLTLDRARS